VIATIHEEIAIGTTADTAWKGDVRRLFAPTLSDSRMEAPGARVAIFVNGMVIKERIVDCDPIHRRVACAVVESDFVHHSAPMQIIPID
jgi:hypothetical protein